MTRFGISFAAIVLAGSILAPASLAQARDLTCNSTLAQYNDMVRRFEAETLKARALADQNPLYESDLGYFTAVLRDAKLCVTKLSPVAAASAR